MTLVRSGGIERSSLEADPQPLRPEDIPQLHLNGHPTLSPDEARAIVAQTPATSYWIPETSEFILVSAWRHRQELLTVHTFGAFGNEDILLNAVMDRAREDGYAGFVVVDVHETRRPSFYARHGLRRFEDIVTYENRRPFGLASREAAPGFEFRRVDGTDRALLYAVLDVDHAAFPWFWWNSIEEFEAYLTYPGVEIWAGIREHEVVAYAGTTQYRGWAHLDRIATRPDLQGHGIGRAMLTFAVTAMVGNGGRRIALSTQGNNERSRGLYQRTGFVRTPSDDYAIFVSAFDEQRIYADMQR